MVLVATHRTVYLAATGPALGVVVLPVTAEPWGGGTTIHAHHTPVLDHKQSMVRHIFLLIFTQKMVKSNIFSKLKNA